MASPRGDTNQSLCLNWFYLWFGWLVISWPCPPMLRVSSWVFSAIISGGSREQSVVLGSNQNPSQTKQSRQSLYISLVLFDFLFWLQCTFHDSWSWPTEKKVPKLTDTWGKKHSWELLNMLRPSDEMFPGCLEPLNKTCITSFCSHSVSDMPIWV